MPNRKGSEVKRNEQNEQRVQAEIEAAREVYERWRETWPSDSQPSRRAAFVIGWLSKAGIWD